MIGFKTSLIKRMEEEQERKAVRRGLAIGTGAFAGILMLVSLSKAMVSINWQCVAWTIFGVIEGLLMIGFIAASQSRR